MSTTDDARAEAERRWPKKEPVQNTLRKVFEQGAEWQASRKVEAAPSDTDLRDLHARYHCQPGNLLGENDCGYVGCRFWDAATFVAPQSVQVEITDALELAMFAVEDRHHFHDVTCLCGFSSHRSRSRTEHITAEIRAALGGGDHE